MDIAKYIGLFLLKNHFCYVHGLGNLELKKQPSNFDGKLLLAPSYKVIVTTGGSIDDNLANFIASNEQVSISKASNELREFSIQSRKDLEAGKEVPIPGLGKFVEEGGKISFKTDESFSFSPAGLPTIRNSKQLEEQVVKPAPIPTSIPIPPQQEKKSINWTMIILAIILLVILGAGVGGYVYYTKSKNKSPLPPEKPYDSTIHTNEMTKYKMDSIRVADSIHTVLSDTLPQSHKIVISNFPALRDANNFVKKLKGNGDNTAEVYVKDTSNFLVLIQVSCKNKDTTTMFDSFKHVYNFQDVKTFR